MWIRKSMVVLGLLVLAGVGFKLELLCTMWCNVTVGLISATAGLYLLQKDIDSAWIIIFGSGLLLLTTYPSFLKCEECCVVSKILYATLLVIGGEMSVSNKWKIKSITSKTR